MMCFRLMETEKVIDEVRGHECLWNPRNASYKHKVDKFKAWEEVSEAVIPKYKTSTEDEKRQIVKAVQARWKTARDAYMKCRYTEAKKPTYKSRAHTYIYKDKLTFLEEAKDWEENGRYDYEGTSDSNSFAENSARTTVVTFDEDEAETNEEMEFDIDVHDDFKDKIKHLITDTAIEDSNDDENQPGTSSQIELKDPLDIKNTSNRSRKRPLFKRSKNIKSKMSGMEAKLLKVMRAKNSTITSALKPDDQFFFDSLAPLIKDFNTHQKLRFRSSILELVKEVRNLVEVHVKQERDPFAT